MSKWAAVRGSVSARIMVDPDTPRCLQVSAILWLCFSFTDPGRREKNKRKKVADWLGLSDPVPTCSQPANRQRCWQWLSDPVSCCYSL
jgi:hypothetical protein